MKESVRLYNNKLVHRDRQLYLRHFTELETIVHLQTCVYV